jgi:hypothetical protein
MISRIRRADGLDTANAAAYGIVMKPTIVAGGAYGS